MPIYRVGGRDIDQANTGYRYFTNKREALKEAREVIAALRDGYEQIAPDEYELGSDPKLWDEPLIEPEPTPKTKADVVALLNTWAAHPDTGCA